MFSAGERGAREIRERESGQRTDDAAGEVGAEAEDHRDDGKAQAAEHLRLREPGHLRERLDAIALQDRVLCEGVNIAMSEDCGFCTACQWGPARGSA